MKSNQTPVNSDNQTPVSSMNASYQTRATNHLHTDVKEEPMGLKLEEIIIQVMEDVGLVDSNSALHAGVSEEQMKLQHEATIEALEAVGLVGPADKYIFGGDG